MALCKLQCPECGQDETFYVAATVNVVVRGDNGKIEEIGDDVLYDESDLCQCAECDYESNVYVFLRRVM